MRGLTGGKLRSDSTSRLSGSVVGLYGILPERGNNTVSVRQVGGQSTYQYVGELRLDYSWHVCCLCCSYVVMVVAIEDCTSGIVIVIVTVILMVCI